MFKKILQSRKSAYVVAALAISTIGFDAFAAGGAVQIEQIDRLADTVKALLNGKASLIIDGIIIGISGYTAATQRSPAPIIYGLISCAIYHAALKILL